MTLALADTGQLQASAALTRRKGSRYSMGDWEAKELV